MYGNVTVTELNLHSRFMQARSISLYWKSKNRSYRQETSCRNETSIAERRKRECRLIARFRLVAAIYCFGRGRKL